MASRLRKGGQSRDTSSTAPSALDSWPMPQASNFHQAQRAMSTTSNATTQSRATTGTGQNSNSAHYSKKYPCPHKGCPQRFNEKKSLNVHKDSEHDYCMPCDLDFEDDEALHIHKMSSARHIVCPICGIDFKSEPGRDRHTKQMHSMQQNVQCRGCHKVFAKGAALILHFEQNLCAPLSAYNNPDEMIHQKQMLETQRALMAMELDMQQKEEKDKPEWASQRDASTVTDTAGGGVNVQPSLMDGKDDAAQESMAKLQPALVASNATSSKDSETSDARSVSSADTAKPGDWPLVSPASVHGSEAQWPSLGTANKVKATAGGPQATWSQQFFPNAPATPASVTTGATDDTAASLNSENPTQSGVNSVPVGRMLEPHPLTSVFHCPFGNCDTQYIDKEKLIVHIKTHCGVLNKCPACYRNFKTPSALTAHMESASTRCNVRETKGYGNALSLVSGGFLAVSGKYEDGTAKFDSTKIPDSFW